MKSSIIHNIIIAILLAFTVNSFVYFGFVNSYSSLIFNHNDFAAQFSTGIYQYRFLSTQLLLHLHEFLLSLHLPYDMLKLKFLNDTAEPAMFLSFYVLNTFFLVMSAVMMVLITKHPLMKLTSAEGLLLTSVGILVIAISQFVIVPYDVSSYFFLLLFFLVFLLYAERKSGVLLFSLVGVLIISAINRETAALSISLAATLLWKKYGFTKNTLVPVGILAFAFVIVYVGIRMTAGSFVTNDGNLLAENFTQPKNLLGLLFSITLFLLTLALAKTNENRELIIVFHLLALPYLLMCFYSGILYEIRLYVPLFLCALMLGQMKRIEAQ